MAVIEYLSVVLGLDHSKFDLDVKRAALSVGGVGKAITAAAAAGTAIKLGFDSVKLAAEAETAGVAFEVLLGSASKAKQAIQDFRQIDRETPLSFIDIQRGAKTMLAFGVEADDLGRRLRQLAAISMGNEERFQSLALAFGQTTSAGRLMGQEALQFINAGFSPLMQLSKSTGISMVQLKKAMEDGAISIDMVKKAFDDATSKGGLFNGMNEKIAETAEGQLAKLQGDFKAIGIEIGESLLPALKEAVKLTRELADPNSGIGWAVRKSPSGFQALGALGSDIINSLKANGKPLERSAMEDLWSGWQKDDIELLKETYKIQNRIKDTRKQGKVISDEQIRNELQAAQRIQEQKKREAADKKRRQEEDNLAEKQKAEREKQLEEAKGIRFQNNPDLAIKEEISRAGALMRAGMLSRNDFIKFSENLTRNFAESQSVRPQDTPFAVKGSVEAYRLMMQREADREEERRLLQTQADLLRNIDRNLDRAPMFKVIRK